MSGGFAIKIGADISGFERGQRDAVSSARRGAGEIATAYVSGGRAAQAAMKSLSITTAAMGLASGGLAATLISSARVGAEGFGEMSRRATESGLHVTSLSDKLGALPMPIAKVVEGMAALDAAKTVWNAFNEALEDTEVRLRRLNQIAEASRQLGTSTSFLTSLAGQAKEYRVEVETLTTMLERAREATRVRLGEGKDAVNEDAFSSRLRRHVDAGNLTAAETAPYRAARDQEGQIRAVLDLIERLKAANRDLAANDLGRAFFGADFETKTRQGIDLVTAFRNALDGAKANGSGLAPTDEEIARAEEFRQREEAIAATIRDAIAPAVHDFNELSDVGKRTWIEWQERVAGWVTWLGEGYLKIRDIAAEVKRMAQSWGLIAEDSGTPEDGPLAIRVKPQAAPRVDRSNPLPAAAAARTAKDPIDPDSVANVIRSLEKARDVAEAEYATFALTNVERLKAVELAKAEAAARADVEKGVRASAALTVEETNRITEAAKASAEFKEQLQDLKDDRELMRSSGGEFMKGFAADLRNGVGLVDALSNAISRLAQRLGDKALDNLADILFGKSGGGQPGLLSSALSGFNPLSMFSGSFGGDGPTGGVRLFAGGVERLDVPGYASGRTPAGLIFGPGTGTSDSILAVTDKGSPIRVSTGESIVNARASAENLDLIRAMNDGAAPEELHEIVSRRANRLVKGDASGLAGIDAFANARLPRFASGGMPGGRDAFPNEPVLTRRTARNLSSAIEPLSEMEGGGGGATTVNVHPPAGTTPQVQKKKSPTGESVDVLIRGVIGSDLAGNGPLAQALQDMYGLNRMSGKQS